MALPRPKPSEVVNGHALFMSDFDGGNAGMNFKVFQPFCSCHWVGGKHTRDRVGAVEQWRVHAQSSEASSW